MHKSTKVAVGNDARKYILDGVNAVYNPVKLTIGPKGGNALLYGTYGGDPRITNDGVTIAECIEPKNEFVNQVATSFKDACKRTNRKAGDATTTTTVIAGKALNDVFQQTEGSVIGNSTADVMAMKNDMLDISKQVEAAITKRAKKVKTKAELEKIAYISVEDEDLGKVISDVVWKVGPDGFVDVNEGFKGYIEHEVIEGLRFPAKVPHKVFVTNPDRYEMEMKDTPVFVTNYDMDNVNEVGDLVNRLFTTSKQRKIAILAPSFSEQVLAEFVKAAKNNYWIYPVKVPSLRTPQFEDVATYLGATFVDKNQGKTLAASTYADLGFVEKMVIKDVEAREDAIAIGGKGSKGEEVKNRIEELKKQLKETRVDTQQKLIERRIASLASSVAVIRVSGSSEAETKYLKLKIEDAVYACKGALEEGYVKGGGLCLKEIAEELPQSILTDALLAPYNEIQNNAGELEIGEDVIDNAKAVRLAVKYAIATVAYLITTKIIVVEENEVTPGEGYEAIAKALHVKNKMYGKKENILTQDNIEGEYDRMLEEMEL